MNTYVLSWFRYEPVTKILHPKWWQVWKKASLYVELEWVRHVVADIPEDEKEVILSHSPREGGGATERLLARLMGPASRMFQLEDGLNTSNYIRSSYTSPGQGGCKIN